MGNSVEVGNHLSRAILTAEFTDGHCDGHDDVAVVPNTSGDLSLANDDTGLQLGLVMYGPEIDDMEQLLRASVEMTITPPPILAVGNCLPEVRKAAGRIEDQLRLSASEIKQNIDTFMLRHGKKVIPLGLATSLAVSSLFCGGPQGPTPTPDLPPPQVRIENKNSTVSIPSLYPGAGSMNCILNQESIGDGGYYYIKPGMCIFMQLDRQTLVIDVNVPMYGGIEDTIYLSFGFDSFPSDDKFDGLVKTNIFLSPGDSIAVNRQNAAGEVIFSNENGVLRVTTTYGK